HPCESAVNYAAALSGAYDVSTGTFKVLKSVYKINNALADLAPATVAKISVNVLPKLAGDLFSAFGIAQDFATVFNGSNATDKRVLAGLKLGLKALVALAGSELGAGVAIAVGLTNMVVAVNDLVSGIGKVQTGIQ